MGIFVLRVRVYVCSVCMCLINVFSSVSVIYCIVSTVAAVRHHLSALNEKIRIQTKGRNAMIDIVESSPPSPPPFSAPPFVFHKRNEDLNSSFKMCGSFECVGDKKKYTHVMQII